MNKFSNVPTISFPLDCIAAWGEVWGNGGNYHHPSLDEFLKKKAITSPIVVDIGANVGAYSLWALNHWDFCFLHAYEPQPDIYEFLVGNLEYHHKRSECHRAGVGNPELDSLRVGRNDYSGGNRLCSSLEKSNEFDASKICSILPPSQLPECNVLKLDCEGAEGYILERLQFIPEFLVLEYHSEPLRLQCEKALEGRMFLIESKVQRPGLGMMKYFKL